MKRLLLASAVLGLAGTIGTANAAVITSDTVTIWNAATPGATFTSISQQGLPTAVGLFGGPLPLVAARPLSRFRSTIMTRPSIRSRASLLPTHLPRQLRRPVLLLRA